jgi:hypothetical protein
VRSGGSMSSNCTAINPGCSPESCEAAFLRVRRWSLEWSSSRRLRTTTKQPPGSAMTPAT